MAVGGFSVMNNHLHLLLRLDPEVAQAWSDSEKASISADLAGIFERLGCSARSWQIQIEKLRGDRLLGRFFAVSRAKSANASVGVASSTSGVVPFGDSILNRRSHRAIAELSTCRRADWQRLLEHI